ncbi:hypothetical protein PIB30_102813 [Stylosanthes scabra]|uniref:Uncharacterized protein n=1 Tax=Stylosanthes scabra TaxID=79078 RepID=A0ABU6ZWH4_9FABA|nr:hypothetical protein [Stylosanthes scabra]
MPPRCLSSPFCTSGVAPVSPCSVNYLPPSLESHRRRWLAKAPAKAPTSVVIGSTAGKPSQPLNDAYSDTEYQNNAGKSAARSSIFLASAHVFGRDPRGIPVIPQT